MAPKGRIRFPSTRYACRSHLESHTRSSGTEKNLNRYTCRDARPTVAELVYRYLASVTSRDFRRGQRNNARKKFRRQHARPKDVTRPNRKLNDNWADVIEQKYSLPLMFAGTANSARSTSTCIADYARAVSEGRTRAKNFVCKALSFGVYSGYLLPTDSQGKLLRVSPVLKLFKTRKRTQGTKGKAND